MSLTPEQKDLLGSHIRRRVAVAGLKNLHRQIANEAREESAAERTAGRVTGIVLGVLTLALASLVVRGVFAHLQTGVSSIASLTSEAWKTACYTALITGVFAVAVYLCLGLRRSALRFTAVAVAGITIASVSVAALYFLVVPVGGCPDGRQSANRYELDRAVAELTTCLGFPRLTTAARAHALQTRGWAYYTRKEYGFATADMEAAFQLKPPRRESDLVRYAVALRGAGRFEDGLQALAHAEQLKPTRASTAIEEERGLILAQLGRHEEAVAAFNHLLIAGEFTPLAYWWRGLSYERMRKPALARGDFEKCLQLLTSKRHLPPELADLLPEVRAKLEQSTPIKK